MKPVNFPGAIVIGKPSNMTDEQCASIHAQYFVDSEGFPRFRTKWMPSPEDMEAFNRGEGIIIDVLGVGLDVEHERLLPIGLRPLSVFTFNENGECNPVEFEEIKLP